MKDLTYSEYYKGVNALADIIIEECVSYDSYLPDVLHQTIDGEQWIIYNHYHDAIISHTSNDEAYLDNYSLEDLGRVVAENGLDHARMIQAFHALEQDVREALSCKKEDLEEQVENLEESVEGQNNFIDSCEEQIEAIIDSESNFADLDIEGKRTQIANTEKVIEDLEEKIGTLNNVIEEL